MPIALPPPRLPGGPYLMGIVNTTPDSFSDGGLFTDPTSAVEQACRLWEAGADLIDIGGESTRPGALPVGTQEEIARTSPVIAALAARIPAWLSIDTMKPQVALAAAQAGARLWNDVGALQAPGALEMAARLDLHVLLMHKQGEPETMQHAPHYENVLEEVTAFLRTRAEAALAAGIARNRIWIDPGIGFGKTLAHNGMLLRALPAMRARLGFPVCVGLSRKRFIAAIEAQAGRPPSAPQARLGGSLAGALFAVAQGADMLRVHDVEETLQALQIMRFLGAQWPS